MAWVRVSQQFQEAPSQTAELRQVFATVDRERTFARSEPIDRMRHDSPQRPARIERRLLEHTVRLVKRNESPWSTSDEWYVMNRNVEAVPGFRILAKVTVTNSSKGTTPRPAVWVTENANAKGGRAFYTGFGHTKESYAVPDFLKFLSEAIVWACGKRK